MSRNMGTADRVIRTAIAVVIAVLYFTGRIDGTLGFVLLVVAAAFLVSSFFATCPAYMAIGVSTCGDQKGAPRG